MNILIKPTFLSMSYRIEPTSSDSSPSRRRFGQNKFQGKVAVYTPSSLPIPESPSPHAHSQYTYSSTSGTAAAGRLSVCMYCSSVYILYSYGLYVLCAYV